MDIPEIFNDYFSNLEETNNVSTDSWKFIKKQNKEIKAKSNEHGYKIDGSGIKTVLWVFEKITKNEDKLYTHEVKIYYNPEKNEIEHSAYYKSITDNGDKQGTNAKCMNI